MSSLDQWGYFNDLWILLELQISPEAQFQVTECFGGRIRRMGDRECWFCASLEDTLTLMRATVMMEGKPYYKVGGSIGRYPKFVPEDYVILRLNPRFQKGEWVQW